MGQASLLVKCTVFCTLAHKSGKVHCVQREISSRKAAGKQPESSRSCCARAASTGCCALFPRCAVLLPVPLAFSLLAVGVEAVSCFRWLFDPVCYSADVSVLSADPFPLLS